MIFADVFLSLVFRPEWFETEATPEKARGLVLRTRECVPIAASLLDYWTQDVDGEPCLMAAAKTMVSDDVETTLEPIFLIRENGSWKFCHPAIVRKLIQ